MPGRSKFLQVSFFRLALGGVMPTFFVECAHPSATSCHAQEPRRPNKEWHSTDDAQKFIDGLGECRSFGHIFVQPRLSPHLLPRLMLLLWMLRGPIFVIRLIISLTDAALATVPMPNIDHLLLVVAEALAGFEAFGTWRSANASSCTQSFSMNTMSSPMVFGGFRDKSRNIAKVGSNPFMNDSAATL